MAWETINHWAHSPVYWGKKGITWKNLAFFPCFIRFHLTTKYLALYWLFLSFFFHSCCCQSPHPFSPPLKSPSSALPFNLPTCSSSQHSCRISSPPLESEIQLKDLGIKKHFCGKLAKNLKEKKNPNKELQACSKEQWRRTFAHLAENLQGSRGYSIRADSINAWLSSI